MVINQKTGFRSSGAAEPAGFSDYSVETKAKNETNAQRNRDFGVRRLNTEMAERAVRLREAVRAAGGNQAVAQRSGVPLSTLGSYLAGGEMKLGNAIALARATGVRLEWLATGEGPMREGEAGAAAAGELQAGDALGAAPGPQPLFGQVKIDRLVSAYEAARQAIGAGQSSQDTRLLMHLTVAFYDKLTEAMEAQKSAENHDSPQRHPQTSPQD